MLRTQICVTCPQCVKITHLHNVTVCWIAYTGLLNVFSPRHYVFLINSSACSITVSNTTCYCNLTFLLLVFIYICSLEWFIISRSIECIYLMNCFRFLSISSLLLTGHLPILTTLLFIISLSFVSLLHWNIAWPTFYTSCLHGHYGLPIIFNRFKPRSNISMAGHNCCYIST